jgi:hypothetical protein
VVADGLARLGLTLNTVKTHFGDEAAHQLIDEAMRHHKSDIEAGLFFPAGGYSSVARARGTEAIRSDGTVKFQKLTFAGLALCTLFQIARHPAEYIRGGASMNKVFWLLERGCPFSPAPKDVSRMFKAWKPFRNVAHLGAAAYLVWCRRGGADTHIGFVIEEMDKILQIAKRFEDFGTTFAPNNTKNAQPVLDPSTIWRVPVTVAPADDAEMPGPLPFSAQRQLVEYRAPKNL